MQTESRGGDNPHMSAAEETIRNWRFGSVQAERLCAALLHLELYEDIDPQHPLGGPDGLKDVLCKRDGKLWVAAAFFPTTAPTFNQIKDKFVHDSVGMRANGATAIAFFVNQRLTIGERQELQSQVPQNEVEVYHLERIRDLVDSPKGCGIRLEYLRIPMTEEEQWSFWSVMNSDIVRRLSENERRHNQQLSSVESKLDRLLMRTEAIEFNLRSQPSSMSVTTATIESVEMPTASFTSATVCWIQRLLTEDMQISEAIRGRFRATQVWIGPAGSTPDTARHIPPSPEEGPLMLDQLLAWWHERHGQLVGAAKNEVAAGLAELHHRFLFLHPFLDGNGRVAKAITDQAARELLNQGIGQDFVANTEMYYSALQAADEGDLRPLTRRVLAALG